MTVDKMAPRRGEFKSAVEVRRPPLARPPAPPPAPAPASPLPYETPPDRPARAQGTAIPGADVVVGMWPRWRAARNTSRGDAVTETAPMTPRAETPSAGCAR